MPCVLSNTLSVQRHGDHRHLHSFPTRRSSDLLLTTGTLTLAAGGDSNAVWVFQVGTGITTGTASVAMINGGQLRNVLCRVGTAGITGVHTAFKANFLAGSAITFTGANTSLVGRA